MKPPYKPELESESKVETWPGEPDELPPPPAPLPEAPPAPKTSPLAGYHFLLMMDGAAVSLHASVDDALEGLRALLSDHLERDVSVHRVVSK